MINDLLALLADTVTLGWRNAGNWRFWYGAGGTITLVLVALRVAPAVVRFFRDTQWTAPAIVMGAIVCTVGPFTMLLLSTLAWPALLGWLLWSQTLRTAPRHDEPA